MTVAQDGPGAADSQHIILRTLERDRASLATALRGETAQVLATVLQGLANIESSDDLEEIRAELRELREVVRADLERVQSLATRIQPSMLDDLGLDVSLKAVARGLAGSDDPSIEVSFMEGPVDLPRRNRAFVFRILEEAMRNAALHAGAQRIAVTLVQMPRELKFLVYDDGRGFDVHAHGRDEALGSGLTLMRAQARALGGALNVTSKRGAGTRVVLSLPRKATR